MPLHLLRRHRRACKGDHSEDSFSGEFDERKKGWRRCTCPIVVSGILAGRSKRVSTEHTDWETARAVAMAWEALGTWAKPAVWPPVSVVGAASPAPAPATTPPGAATVVSPITHARVPIPEAGKVYVVTRAGRGIKPSTLKKYRTFVKQLTAFADTKGYVFVDQFTMTDVDIFFATWRLGARTKGKRLPTLRGFFRFCKNRKWLTDSPVSEDLKPPVGANRPANKAPFTDDELERIFKACGQLKVEWWNESGYGVWTGEDLKDFIGLMVYTGFRISDTAFFDISRLLGNEIFLRASKNGGDVFAYLPDWLRDRLNARSRRYGRFPFRVSPSERLETVTNLWRRKIARAFKLAGPFAEPPTPHRFRHTFARILLQRGVSVADVADLLGDDEETIRRHYARWVPERQARLTQILQDAFTEKHKFAVIHGGRT